jgi:hypothetical protein
MSFCDALRGTPETQRIRHEKRERKRAREEEKRGGEERARERERRRGREREKEREREGGPRISYGLLICSAKCEEMRRHPRISMNYI